MENCIKIEKAKKRNYKNLAQPSKTEIVEEIDDEVYLIYKVQ
jgi:hypothetical protein